MDDLYKFTKEQLIYRIKELEGLTSEHAEPKQSPDLFKALYKGTDEIIYQINNEGLFILSEGKGLSKIGLEPGQVVGLYVYDVYKDNAIIINSIKKAFQGVYETYEVKINDYYFKNWFTPVKDEHGEITSILGLSVDISEQKRLELEYQNAERLLSSSIDNAAIGMCRVNLEGKFISANLKLCDLFGYSESELKEMKFQDITHPEDIEIGSNAVKSMLSNKQSQVSFEKRYIHKKGQIIDVLVNSVVIRDNNNSPLFFFTQLVDQTETKKAKEQLLISHNKWQSTFDAMKNSVSIIDLEGKIIQCNKATIDLFDLNEENLTNLSCHQIVHGTDKPFPDCPMARMKISKKTESMIFQDNNTWLKVNVDPLFDNNNLIGAVHVISDISELKNAEEQVYGFSKIFEESLNEIYLFNFDDLKFNQVNNSALNNLGYTLDEMKKITPVDIKPEFSADQFNEYIQPLLDGEVKKLEFETIHQRKDKTEYHVEVHLQTLDFKETIMCAAIVMDISKRKAAIKALVESEEKFRKILQSTPLPLCYVDKNGSFDYINDRFIKVLGYDKNDIPDIETWWLKAYPDEKYREKVRSDWNKFILEAGKTNEDIPSEVYQVYCGDGKTRHIIISGITFGDEFLATFLDITAQKMAEEKLIDNQEHLEAMIKSRTKELEEKNKELDNALKVFVGREQTIRDLQKKIRILKGSSE